MQNNNWVGQSPTRITNHLENRGDNVISLVRIILLGMCRENRSNFIYRMTAEFAPDIQVRLYGFIKAMIRAWAGQDNLSGETAAVIEDCRKICDLMGWPADNS